MELLVLKGLWNCIYHHLQHQPPKNFFAALSDDLRQYHIVWEITQNVAFEILNFGIFHQFLSY